MAFLIFPNGTRREVIPREGKEFSLEELQGFVGGYLEHLRLSAELHMFINEDGKRLQLEANPTATCFAEDELKKSGRMLKPLDVIVGTAFIFKTGEVT